jgi:uncharacterized membrane protein YfcA
VFWTHGGSTPPLVDWSIFLACLLACLLAGWLAGLLVLHSSSSLPCSIVRIVVVIISTSMYVHSKERKHVGDERRALRALTAAARRRAVMTAGCV